MLLDSILHHVRAVADIPEVGVHPAHHLLRAVAQLTGDCVEAHRRAAIECLKPGGAVGVSEGLGAELASGKARPHRDTIEEPMDVHERSLTN